MRFATARLPTAAARLSATVVLLAFSAGVVAAASPPGPPYPEPVAGQRVYDEAGIFSEATIGAAAAMIKTIEDRTGAEVVVYTQVKPESDTPEAAQADADALGNQWHVGRKGFDDGLVILFDMESNLRHGQVQLDAGSGFAASYLSNDERQSVYEHDMLPLLKDGDLDAALLAGLGKIDAAATPEHARSLETARQLNAVLGLLGGPIVFLGLAFWPFFHWLRFGRDPVYLDDPSILMPAPPADLTAATGALVYDGRGSRRTLTVALIDLATRGEIAFEPEREGLIIKKTKVRIHDRGTPPIDAEDAANRALNRRRPLSDAEDFVLERVRSHSGGNGVLDDAELLSFGQSVVPFEPKLEEVAVAKGWFTEPPAKVTARWRGIAVAEFVAAAIAVVGAINTTWSGLFIVAVALALAGIITLSLAGVMPARTMAGAVIRAMLFAYRRTLQKTMAQATSMKQVVAEAGLSWIETPDQAVVWGVALGLQGEVEAVLRRSVEGVREGGPSAASVWLPGWYAGSFGPSGPGGFMGAAVPDFVGMMTVLGTVGNTPSSHGGSGGSFGGGGGFGGGGAGGGF
jgi:uncharacterized membrane protein YgcG